VPSREATSTSGRLVVVTGGSRGIGRAIVDRFLEAGDRVVAIGRDRDALATIAADTEVCDVTDEAEVTRVFARLRGADVLVNNAGVSSSAPLQRTTLSDWHAQLEVNATGVFLCTRAILPHMVTRGRGRVIIVASTAGRVGYRYSSAYVASKHAAVGLMRALATEVAGTGVTVNAVCPSFARTDMTRRSVERIVAATRQEEADVEAALGTSSPIGRLLEPTEVAAAVAFLASDDAAAINGQALVLDGGGVQA
jgi:NAD(P)-dependent dehydrogenase (short-subunit alcohol dehydrogenase family)